jgi:hypothetical protein
MAEKVSVEKQTIENALQKLETVFGNRPFFQGLKEKFSQPTGGKILGYPTSMKLLEGKTFDLEYEDGVGLVKVDVTGEGQILSSREKELLERAFYLSDYYIFRDSSNPKRRIQIGDSWTVDAKNLAGVLDPRMRHKAQGDIYLYRDQNQGDSEQTWALFVLKKGLIKMVDTDSSRKIKGEVELKQGNVLYHLAMQYITKATITGIANYHEISTDHLLFGSRLLTQPRLSAQYECKCRKK